MCLSFVSSRYALFSLSQLVICERLVRTVQTNFVHNEEKRKVSPYKVFDFLTFVLYFVKKNQ